MRYRSGQSNLYGPTDKRMNRHCPDQLVTDDNWSDLSRIRQLPVIDYDRLYAYRLDRIKSQMRDVDAALCILVSPISLRYAVDCRSYQLFQSHVPTTYLFIPLDGPIVIHSVYGPPPMVDEVREGRGISFFDGGSELNENAKLLAGDVDNFLNEIGSSNRRVAVEYVNPSITQSLETRGIDVIDASPVIEQAHLIKSEDELTCMRWAIAVAEHGLAKLRQAIQPGVSELQLWALFNYTNLANNGDWHEGRMLASGPRTNPWLQEASPRKVDSGDLVGIDTDMVGPFGYCADISRTFHCGPDKPTRRQKELYRIAIAEIEHNLKLVRAGTTFNEFQERAYPIDEEFQQHAYPCLLHGVGMCDEYPRVNPAFRGANPYDGTIEAGMVLCIESFIGAVGEADGIKLEQQVLVTDEGYELLTHFPMDESMLD